MGSDTEAEKSIQKEKKKVISLAPIAKPLAGKKLQKRTFKLIQKAAGKKCLKRGVKEVVKSIRRGQKGPCTIKPMLWIKHYECSMVLYTESELWIDMSAISESSCDETAWFRSTFLSWFRQTISMVGFY
ncbi:hypothetical protein F2Q70_00014125 [Brassica cretica]|uniref:H/ACA ribonucleoprotein complex subunit 2 n=1 Tax=Brassica cretica TaxID=69181 RepID=A0A8S9I2X6_BRACR|nr:hypothetical protein F2Q70_00014125 [Brassica cretica]